MSGKNLVAIVGIMDGSAGQIESWFEQASGMRIGCFVIPSDEYTYIDVAAENARRVCQTTAFPTNGTFKGHKLVISASWPEKISALGITNVLCLNPNNQKRLQEINLARAANLKLVSAIHPTATVLPGARVADGVWLNANCTVGYKAEISAGCIINTNASIDHHNVLEECCQIDPGVVTAGNVIVRKCAHVHTGVVIINRMEIGENAIVGAGAVVISKIPAGSTAVGVPARVIKSFT